MRIVYILNTLSTGGAERVVVSLAERMAARGHTVQIIVLLEKRSAEMEPTVPVVRLGMLENGQGVLRGLGRAIRAMWALGPEIIHGNNFHGNLLGRAMRLVCPGARVISTLHNEYEGGRARMLALKYTDALAARTVAVCQAVADRALRLGILSRRKCLVIANGIDVGFFAPDELRRAEVRRAQDAGGDFIWVSVGRLTEAKDYATLLEAFSHVREQTRGTQLWIAGAGEEDYAEMLQIRARQLGLAASVQWLGARRDVAALLDAADGFVLASAWEGMPLAVAEAMAMEKPVVATAVGGVSELLGNCGLVAPPRDARALARAMLSVLNTPPEARRFLGKSARERVMERFNMESKADDWEALYREVAGRRNR